MDIFTGTTVIMEDGESLKVILPDGVNIRLFATYRAVLVTSKDKTRSYSLNLLSPDDVDMQNEDGDFSIRAEYSA